MRVKKITIQEHVFNIDEENIAKIVASLRDLAETIGQQAFNLEAVARKIRDAREYALAIDRLYPSEGVVIKDGALYR